MNRGRPWIEKKASASLHPSQVETALAQLSDAWPGTAPALLDVIEKFPLGEAALFHLVAMSSICATRLARHPEMLLWLSQPEICLARRGHGQMLNDLRLSSSGLIATNNFRALRSWKSREMTRIALRELADLAALEETTAELSQLAEICVAEVFQHWNKQFRENSGSPRAEFAVLALGKLGGRELNHSSDIDLLFLYSDEGHLSPHVSYHQWFNRLSEKSSKLSRRRIPKVRFSGSIFACAPKARPGRSHVRWGAWNITTPASAKLGSVSL